MLAAVNNGTRNLELREVPLRDLQPDEVLIKIDSATICGTDLHILEGEFEAEHVALGHEFSGVIAQLGRSVSTFSVGDEVTVEPHIYCGLCKPCRIGKPHLCTDRRAWGIHYHGGFAQYAIVRQDTVYRIPPNISLEEAALGELVGCCMHGINRAQVETGDTVVILGGGAVGVILAQLAKLRGAAKIIISEPSEYRRNFFQTRGVQRLIDPRQESVKDIIMEETGGLGADVVIDAAGRKETAQQALELVGRGGRVLYFGVVPPGDLIQIEPNYIFANEITILGTIRNPFVHHRVVEMLPKLDLKEVITHRIPLTDIEEAFSLARSGAGMKICVKPNL